ncbi:hypothetical protein ODJ79_09815 [Actinoplanes sp. KI2]|uniref:hypothetical protein n=1 Tax=Actinoplanes sp. KI2 TaxID=2983315 RepID=UPI0021D5F86D|nr:hypothetical protein [Actinoplanes sp. KI2]MCU7724011.1 hypothetical protein [Actinoplanes sp. KI2]
MNEQLFSAETRNEAQQGLARVMTSFVEEIGSKPTLAEFLDVLGASVPTNSESVEAVTLPMRFKVKLKGNRRYESETSRTFLLNDATFVHAADFLEFFATRISAAYGRPASPRDFAAGVLDLLKSMNTSFQDIAAHEVHSIAAQSSKRSTKAAVGDILAIPMRGARYRMSVVVARNRFGTALGLFDGASEVPRVGASRRRGPVLYTDDQLIAKGAWIIVGHEDSLLSLFPAEPEIYHSPDPIFPNTQIGEFGAAESPSGELRQIGREEASQVGLLDNTYRQIYLSTYLNQLVDENQL